MAKDTCGKKAVRSTEKLLVGTIVAVLLAIPFLLWFLTEPHAGHNVSTALPLVDRMMETPQWLAAVIIWATEAVVLAAVVLVGMLQAAAAIGGKLGELHTWAHDINGGGQ